MPHVNANHSAVVSGFPSSIKLLQAGRNILAFTKRGDCNKRSRGENDREICNLIFGVRLNRKVCVAAR